MINTSKLRNKILSVAYRGELTKAQQFPRNDKIESIHKEIREFKSIDNDERFFSIPNNWVWTRIKYISNHRGQKIPTEDFCYLDIGTIDNKNNVLMNRDNVISFLKAPSRARKIVKNGDIIYSTVRPYLHNVCIVDGDFKKETIASTAFAVIDVNKEVVLNEYLFYWLLSIEFDKYANDDSSKGALYPAIREKDFWNSVIPICSIAEQKEIVRIIKESYSKLNLIDDIYSKIVKNSKELKNKIIDEAIFEDCLVKRIDRNKWKTLKDITNDSTLNDGNWILSEDMTQDGPINLLQLGNIGDCCFKETNYKHLTKNHFDELGCRQIYPGYLLINRLVADKMLSCIIPNIDGMLITSVDACWIAPNEDVYNLKYIMYMLSSSYFQKEVKLKGKGVTRFRISKTNLVSIPFPLPEKSEQDKIVGKIENAFSLIERIIS